MSEQIHLCQHNADFNQPHHCTPYQVSDSKKKIAFQESQTIEEKVAHDEHCPSHMDQELMPCDVPQPPKIVKDYTTNLEENKLTLSEQGKGDELHESPCYLPQPEDQYPNKDHLQSMGPLGPWATGKVDWSPISGLTGIRPIVDRYSITRHSPGEWRENNKEVLTKAYQAYDVAQANLHNCQSIKPNVYNLVDRSQSESNKRLKDRAKLVEKWMQTLERAIKAYIEEICALEQGRLRLKKSLAILNLPYSIASECMERRSTRPEPELVRDEPEEELIKELALIEEIRLVFNKTLSDVEQQQKENRAARHRLEVDWSDKQDAYAIEVASIGLDNNSKTILFKPGSVKFPSDQSSEEYWEHSTKETLEECEICRQKSIRLRSTLNEIIMNAARDLRTQADAVEKAFSLRISCMQEILIRLEKELSVCLGALVETENRIDSMKKDAQKLDYPLKVVQTRLDNRHYRPFVENCRDYALKGLVEEVKVIQEGLAAMLASINEAEKVKEQLISTRIQLEKEIILKKRAIAIDKEQCMLIRSNFPSAAPLSGFSSI